MREGRIDDAVERFRKVTASKDKVYGPIARVTLGQLLFKQGKTQQAIFELRKAASASPPTVTSVQAHGFLVLFLKQLGKKDEHTRARKDQLEALEGLSKREDAEASSYGLYLLGLEHMHDGRKDVARARLEEALKRGGLAAEDLEKVKEVLSRLSA